MTREELHSQVWSQPMRTLAKSLGISDVALAKRCKSSNVPVPPRGWWARKDAGQSVEITPLPPPPFAMANYFPALAEPTLSDDIASEEAEQENDEVPPPVFRDFAAVTDEIRWAVMPIKVPASLTKPHRAVERLLKQDAQRKPSTSSWMRDGPKFGSPVQQRRLRILSCVLTELERLGCRVSGSTHAGEKFSVSVGGSWSYILFGIEGGDSWTHFPSERGRVTIDRERLRFDLVHHDDRRPSKRSWREDKSPIESQATEIVRGILLQAETDSREWALFNYKWDREERQRKIAAAKAAAEKAEADRLAREKAAAAARLEALVGGAEALERAAQIRRYVEAVQTACHERASPIDPQTLEQWTRWALAEADAIDPVRSGRFLADLQS